MEDGTTRETPERVVAIHKREEWRLPVLLNMGPHDLPSDGGIKLYFSLVSDVSRFYIRGLKQSFIPATGLEVWTLLEIENPYYFFSPFELQAKKEKKMENNNEWLVRKRRYWFNNNFVGKIIMRVYYRLWLVVSVIMFVYILIMFFSSF